MKTYALDQEKKIQIDVKEVTGDLVRCDLLTGSYCASISMRKEDYSYLVQQGFFIRDGLEKDDANVLNTTEEYRVPLIPVID